MEPPKEEPKVDLGLPAPRAPKYNAPDISLVEPKQEFKVRVVKFGRDDSQAEGN